MSPLLPRQYEKNRRHHRLGFFLLLVSTPLCESFAPSPRVVTLAGGSPIQSFHRQPVGISSRNYQTSLLMAQDDEGQGILQTIGVGFLILLFVGSGLLPLLDGGGRDLSIADSVVTRQDAPTKLRNYENKEERLSRSTIQEKLSSIPVFYVSQEGSMQSDIYLSYADATEAAGDSATVKATSLDQVMYPLVLKRGRMRMEPPPAEVAKAESELSGESGKTYRLIASKAAREQATEFKMELADGDIPLFVAERLAFAGPKGPQLPLFTDKNDCVFSYQRLRQGKKSLPEEATVRSTSLMDEIYSMEKGTRPGVNQLVFYANADDVQKAVKLFEM